ncbi:hypothetical protein HZB03_04915 [Candidatus Woesearchaeota archaeon]|nr:hypothetical protein [Candidatus Woesearchaeota archaeon]
MQEFAKVYEHKIKHKNLEKLIIKQMHCTSIFPNDQKTRAFVHARLQAEEFYKRFNDKIYHRRQKVPDGTWNQEFWSVKIGKSKIRLVPYDFQFENLDVVVRDLVTGATYRAPRIHPEFECYDDVTSDIYSRADPIAVIVQVAEYAGVQTSLGATYIGEQVLEPRLQDIKGEPIFIPQWLSPVEVIISNHFIETGCFRGQFFAEPCMMLTLKGGVICDSFFGRILEGHIIDIKLLDPETDEEYYEKIKNREPQ